MRRTHKAMRKPVRRAPTKADIKRLCGPEMATRLYALMVREGISVSELLCRALTDYHNAAYSTKPFPLKESVVEVPLVGGRPAKRRKLEEKC